MARPIPHAAPPVEGRLRMSYEAYRDWAGEDTHAEWVDGEVMPFVPPKRIHYRLVLFLGRLLAGFADRFGYGEVGVAPFEMFLEGIPAARQPDIFFVASANLDRLTDDRIEGPADLVVEIVSDDSVTKDRHEKFEEYRRAGVREYWILDPRPRRRRADFFRLSERRTYERIRPDERGRIHSSVLPNFWLDPEWLWQDPLPNPDDRLRRILAGHNGPGA